MIASPVSVLVAGHFTPVSSPPRTLVALTPRELDIFFPGALRDHLAATLPGAKFIDPKSAPGEWAGVLSAFAPEVMVTAWDCAPIPADLPSLRYICHVTGSVRHHIDRALIERGVVVSNWGAVASETVAEAALMMILCALRRAQYFGDLMHRQQGWSPLPAGTQSLFDRRVGIHGFGLVAKKLVVLLRPFRCQIRAFTKGVPESWFSEHSVDRAESLESLFDWADVLVEAEGLTPATRGLVTAPLLSRLRAGGTFVNIGRGALVDEQALAHIAATGRIRIASDVYETEPLHQNSPLRGLTENVTLFPHVGGPTDDRFQLCGEFALRNLRTYLSGGTPEARVTLEVFDRAT